MTEPNLGAATPKVLESFAGALEGRTELRRKIEVYSAKEVPTVRINCGLHGVGTNFASSSRTCPSVLL